MQLDEALELQAQLEGTVAASYGAWLMQELSHPSARMARRGRSPTAGGPLSAPLLFAEHMADALPPLAHRVFERRVIQPPTPPMLGVTRGREAGDDGFRIVVRLEDDADHNRQAAEAITKQAGGQTEISVVGRLEALATPETAATRGRHRPLAAGSSLAHAGGTAGTATGFVTSAHVDGLAVVSNNHVIAKANRARPGDPVLQPAREDGGSKDSDAVAALSFFVPLHHDGVNRFDCAMAAVHTEVGVDPKRLGSEHTLTGVDPREPPDLSDAEVYKLGRTTGLTRGVVTAFNVAPRVWYGRKRLEFAGQLEIEGVDGDRFSAPGDSGALVYLPTAPGASRVRAVAVLFAGSRKEGVSYATPLAGTLGALSAELSID